MINFWVDSIAALLKKFTEQGVKVIGEPQVYDYGTFLHIEDPEGNKIEL
jgi:D-3-phosphoglycerate dehydrogenase